LFVEIVSGAGAAAGAIFVEPLGCVEALVVLEEPRLLPIPAQPASENPTSEIHTAT